MYLHIERPNIWEEKSKKEIEMVWTWELCEQENIESTDRWEEKAGETQARETGWNREDV